MMISSSFVLLMSIATTTPPVISDVKLYIDSRESHIIKDWGSVILESKCQAEVKALSVGDFQICAKVSGGDSGLSKQSDQQEKVILLFERKTWSDLHSSVCSGNRGRDQRNRMIQSGCDCVYLIEGDKKEFTKKYDISLRRKLEVFLEHAQIQGIMVFYVDGIEQTVMKLLEYFKKVCNGDYHTKKKSEIKAFSEIQTITKKSGLNPEEYFLVVLKQIPSVSYECAKVIQTVFPTLSSMFDCDPDELQKRLCAIPYGKTKIGQSRSQKIVSYLRNIKTADLNQMVTNTPKTRVAKPSSTKKTPSSVSTKRLTKTALKSRTNSKTMPKPKRTKPSSKAVEKKKTIVKKNNNTATITGKRLTCKTKTKTFVRQQILAVV